MAAGSQQVAGNWVKPTQQSRRLARRTSGLNFMCGHGKALLLFVWVQCLDPGEEDLLFFYSFPFVFLIYFLPNISTVGCTCYSSKTLATTEQSTAEEWTSVISASPRLPCGGTRAGCRDRTPKCTYSRGVPATKTGFLCQGQLNFLQLFVVTLRSHNPITADLLVCF